MASLLNRLLSTAAVAVVLASGIAAASAAPVVSAINPAQVQAPAAQGLVQDVYWIRRHGHRVWVSNHRRYR